MRKLFFLLIITALGLGAAAQAPQGISHQAVVRNAANRLVTTAPVGIKVSILRGSASGTLVYSETHTITSNSNGLVTFVIGQGAVISGVFANIDWTNGPYFVKTEMDPTGSANYSITGTSQLLSVPYALHASSITGGNVSNWNDAFNWGNHASAGYVVGSSRTLTINGVAQNLSTNRTWNVGTVTSVGLALPSIFAISESPVTGSGTLTASFVSQPANRVFASPVGGSGTPTFRALLAADIPDLDWSKITSGKPTTTSGYGITDAVTISGNQTIAGPMTFSSIIFANEGLNAGGNKITNLANPLNSQDAVTKSYLETSIGLLNETDPLFMAAAASSIISGDIVNWNTAFGWGNHANANYALSARTITINEVTHNLSADRTWNVGTVTSIGLALPDIFSVSDTPVKGSGTISANLVSQNANLVLASPNGTPGTPSFRALLAADIPNLDWSKITTGKPTTISGYDITDAVTTSGNQTIAGIKTFSSAIVASAGLNAGNNRITNMANPENDQDAVTKAYLDSRIQNGTSAGEMLYWNDSTWMTIPPGSNGQSLVFCNGVPSWGGCLPTVTTAAITNNNGTSATGGGNILNDGGVPIVQRGVCWNISPNPTLDNNQGYTTDGSGTGAFTSEITGLTELTTYFVRAYAINDIGITYGEQVQFTSPLWTCGLSSITDADGNFYNTVQIGSQCWMAENLNVGNWVAYTPSDNGIVEKYCYGNDPVNCDNYGGLYTWNEMMDYQNLPGEQGICPDGWHLPTHSDFLTLMSQLGGAEVAGGKLKEVGNDFWDNNVGATNESGFSGRGGGYHTGAIYTGFREFGDIWTSTRESGQNYYFGLYNSSTTAWTAKFLSSYALSVRCIKN